MKRRKKARILSLIRHYDRDVQTQVFVPSEQQHTGPESLNHPP